MRAVLETNPHVLAQAAVSDQERKTKGSLGLGPLHGIPILVKDNIATLHEEGRCVCHLVWDTPLTGSVCAMQLFTVGMNTTSGRVSSCSVPRPVLHMHSLAQDLSHFLDLWFPETPQLQLVSARPVPSSSARPACQNGRISEESCHLVSPDVADKQHVLITR